MGAGGAGGEGGGPSFIPSEINKLCVIIKMKTSICVRVIFFATKSVAYLAKKKINCLGYGLLLWFFFTCVNIHFFLQSAVLSI